MLSEIEKFDLVGDGGSLLSGNVSGTKPEAPNPVRETADHFAALLWHPALPRAVLA